MKEGVTVITLVSILGGFYAPSGGNSRKVAYNKTNYMVMVFKCNTLSEMKIPFVLKLFVSCCLK